MDVRDVFRVFELMLTFISIYVENSYQKKKKKKKILYFALSIFNDCYPFFMFAASFAMFYFYIRGEGK